MRSFDGISSTVTLTAVPVIISAAVSCIELAASLQDYDNNRLHGCDRGETRRAEVIGGVDFQATFDKVLLSSDAGDAENITNKPLLATRSLISVMVHRLSETQEGYVELSRYLAGKVLSN